MDPFPLQGGGSMYWPPDNRAGDLLHTLPMGDFVEQDGIRRYQQAPTGSAAPRTG